MFTRSNLISAPDKILVLVAIFVSFLVKNFSLDSMLLVVGCNLSCFFLAQFSYVLITDFFCIFCYKEEISSKFDQIFDELY